MTPKRNKGEKLGAYISRCMSNAGMVQEHPKELERLSVLYRGIEAPAGLDGLVFNSVKAKDDTTGLRHLMSNLVRKETIGQKDYIVCPTVLICEGVHNDLFYPAEELSKFPMSWDGRPVVINHPEKMGKPTSAGSPEVAYQQTVGVLYNTWWNEQTNKLHGEVWIDEEKCKEISPKILTQLKQELHIEVSTGLFTESDQEVGQWNDEKYKGTLRNYRPDHLALLPDSVGACSWEDGGGMPRVNEEEEEEVPQHTIEVLEHVARLFCDNELSHDELWSQLNMVVKESAGTTAFVIDVFDKFFIYDINSADGLMMYKQSYSKSDKGVALVGKAQAVKRKTEYIVAEKTTGDASDGQGDTTTKKGAVMNRAQKVKALIANSDWGEGDTELLMGMSDEQFSKVEGKKEPEANADADAKDKAEAKKLADAEAEAEAEKKLAENEADEDEEPVVPKTLEQVLSSVEDPDVLNTLKRSVARDKAIKIGMVEELMGNDSCSYTEEQLNSKGIEELETLLKMVGSVKKSTDFSARVPAINTDAEKIPAMPVLCAQKKD